MSDPEGRTSWGQGQAESQGANLHGDLREQELRLAADLGAAFKAERELRSGLRHAYLDTVHVLAAAVEARDAYTGAHVERVVTYSVTLGRLLHLTEDDIYWLRLGAALHDIGKIGVPDAVLRKEAPLTSDELEIMRLHTTIGAGIAHKVAFLHRVEPVIRWHHERWNGTGYPDALAGDAIPIAAQITALADAFDAMTTDRVYRRARSLGSAVSEIGACRGTQFAPQVVDAFQHAFAQRLIP